MVSKKVAYTVAGAKIFNRETEALLQASKKLTCNKLTLITTDESRNVEIDGKTIQIYSAVDWLLRVQER